MMRVGNNVGGQHYQPVFAVFLVKRERYTHRHESPRDTRLLLSLQVHFFPQTPGDGSEPRIAQILGTWNAK